MSLPKGWHPLERSQSLNLETELHRELASTHQLYGRQLRAVARRGGRDDILAEVLKRGRVPDGQQIPRNHSE